MGHIVNEHVAHLFDDYAARRARGDRPDVDDYLRRAGEGADELGDLIDALLRGTPAPPPDPGLAAAFEAWAAGRPPLAALRVERGRRRDEVVAAMRAALGLSDRVRERLADRYHQLETGLLDAARVDRRVLEAVARALSARVEDLLAWPPPAPPPAAPLMRVRTESLRREAVPAPGGAPAARAADDDEARQVDRLFGLP